MGRRTGLMVLVASGALLAIAAAAQGAGGLHTVVANRVDAGPVFAGRGVAWVERTQNGLELYEGLGRRRLIQRFARPRAEAGRRISQFAYLNGSDTRLVAQLVTTSQPLGTGVGGTGEGAEYLAGPVGGELSSIGKCTITPGSAFGDIATSADAIAHRACDDQLRVDVQGQPSAALGEDVHGVRAAGDYLAFLDGNYNDAEEAPADVVVYRMSTKQVVYRIPSAAFPSRVRSLALAADGTTAFSFEPAPANTRVEQVVGWASPVEPRVHRTSLPVRSYYNVQVANSRIVYERDAAAHGFSSRSDLGEVVIGGRSHTAVRKQKLGQFAFDGTRISVNASACGRRRIITGSLRAIRHQLLRKCRRGRR